MEGRHPAAVDRLGGRLDAERAGHRVGHRALQRVGGVEIALDGPALHDAQRQPERVLARAVVVDAPRRPPQGGGRHRVTGRGHSAGEVPDAQPAGREDLGHPRDVLGRAAVRRARQGEVAVVESQALQDAGLDGRQSLQRLGRRAHEGVLVVVAVAQPPREAVLALDASAALDDDAAHAQAMTVRASGQTPKTASAVSPM